MNSALFDEPPPEVQDFYADGRKVFVADMRTAIARKVLGNEIVTAIEQGVEGAGEIKRIFDILVNEGPSGLFQYLAGEFERMKEQVLGEAGKAIAEALVVAGIKKIIGIISGLVSGGVGTVVTIVATIIDVVLWFRDNAAQLAELVQTIAGTVNAILQGQVGAVANAINGLLKRLLPVLLGFLGALIGIGGVVSKIQKIFKAIQKPATKAITALFTKLKKAVKGLLKKIKKRRDGKRGKGLSPAKVRRKIIAALRKPAKSDDPATAISEVKERAEMLRSTYQPKLSKGTIRIAILDTNADGVEKDGDVDVSVALSPATKTATPVKVSLVKKFAKEIGASHPAAREDVRTSVGALSNDRPKLRKWANVKAMLNDIAPIGAVLGKPVLQAHALGSAMSPFVTAGALKVDKEKTPPAIAAVVGKINAGAGFYDKPRTLFQAAVFNARASTGKMQKAVTEAVQADADSAEPMSKRLEYLGATPGKDSKTGREVQARMRRARTLKTDPVTGATIFRASNRAWYPTDEADMSHTTDAVAWWNKKGRRLGPRSAGVRKWMLDAKNYVLDHYSLNRSAGAKLPDRYQPPAA